MSVLSKNPFELLADSESTDVIASPKKEVAKESSSKRLDNSRARPQDARLKRDYPQRGGHKSVPVGGRASAPRSAPVADGDDGFEERRESGRTDRGRGRGRGRGGRGGRGRDFDRRSGSDRKDGEKKDVAGKGSWGESTTEDDANPESNEETAETKENLSPTENKEEEVKTLDEYLSELAAKKANLKTAEIRKPNDGADDSLFKNAVPLQKQDVDESDELAAFIFGAGKTDKGKSKKVEKTTKVHLDIQQTFTDSERAARRGGRGGFRGGSRGRGGRNGGRSESFNINDTRAFPTLGS